MRPRLVRISTVIAIGALVAGAGALPAAGAPAARPVEKVNPKDCPLSKLAKATKPVDITFWEVQQAKNQDSLEALANQFNQSQSKVRVNLVQIPSYDPDEIQKYLSGLKTGDLPDVAQFEETTVQKLVDSGGTIPVDACIRADRYSLRDFLPRGLAYYRTNGIQRSIPWSVSNPVLIYNQKAFDKAGITKPPATFTEMEAVSKKLVDAKIVEHGVALPIHAYFNEFFYAKGGRVYVNNRNGRAARATRANLDNSFGRQLWAWWKHMVDTGLMLNTGPNETGADHLFALRDNHAAMTIEATTVLGPVLDAIQSGQAENLSLAVAPLPGFRRPGGGVPVGDGSLWIVKHGDPVRRAAAWQWIKFLNRPENIATFSIETGAIPMRKSAVALPALQQFWQQHPEFRVGYDQLVSGPLTSATVGSLIGDYQGVREAVRSNINAMLTGGVAPATALRRAQQQADRAIADYNDRLGI
ncbi:MAG: ABC transporter substrate-binding protein [Acidimicrobiia bacterium]